MPEAKKRKSERKKQGQGKKKYKVRNWKEYNEALVNRGRIIFHITDEAIRSWEEAEREKKRGRPKKFSDTAIETALLIQQSFRLPLRATEGLLAEMLGRLGVDCKAPDYSTLSIRGKALSITIRTRPVAGNVHVLVDSTGIKVYGEGEWKVRKHGWSKRRTWLELHIGVDEKTGDILMGEVTNNSVHDSEMLPVLLEHLEHISIGQCSGDGAYDTRRCYESLEKHGVKTISIPPQKNAKIWKHGNTYGKPHPRDENLRSIREIGRKAWEEGIGYHRRSLAETAMFRIKTLFGDKVLARTFGNQRSQILLRLQLLNRMTLLGMPESYVVA